MQRRVVITGLGVIASNANGIEAFKAALIAGRSGLASLPELQRHGFACTVGGVPKDVETVAREYLSAESRYAMNEAMTYAALSALEAFRDAGLKPLPYDSDEVMEDTGAIIGTGIGGIDTFAQKVYPAVESNRVKRLGSGVVEQLMSSSAAASVAGLLGLGNQVFSNSSACSTGTEAIVLGTRHIQAGRALRMVVGGTEATGAHIWAGFDAMRVLNRQHNDSPERASRPLSETAGGFIPAGGSGILILEELESARERGARIYAEVLGTAANSGGMRGGGSMTAPNPKGIQSCLKQAIGSAAIDPQELDYINGHLTATIADSWELNNWSQALGRRPGNFPWINATKSMIGHSLGAAGAIESVATILQLHHSFLHGSLNCEDFNPSIQEFSGHVPKESRSISMNIAAKASFGFGDVNSCVIFRKWSEG